MTQPALTKLNFARHEQPCVRLEVGLVDLLLLGVLHTVIIAFLMFPSAILLMRTFSQGLKMTDTDLKTSRTVAIGIM